MNKLEVLADSIIHYTDYSNPESLQYQYRNPLGLQMFCSHAQPFKTCHTCCTATISTMHLYESGATVQRKYDVSTGLRIFDSHIQGYQAGLYDLRIKCSGKSKSKVTENSSIRELIRSYYLPEGTASYAAKFLRRALKDQSISEDTPINYFVTVKEEVVNG